MSAERPMSSPFLDVFREKLARGELLTHDEASQLLSAHDTLLEAYHDVEFLAGPALPAPEPGELAQRFHETYERLAPSFGYTTRTASAVPWAEVPESNRALVVAVCAEILRGASLPAAHPDLERATREGVNAARDGWVDGMEFDDAVGMGIGVAFGLAGLSEPGANLPSDLAGAERRGDVADASVGSVPLRDDGKMAPAVPGLPAAPAPPDPKEPK